MTLQDPKDKKVGKAVFVAEQKRAFLCLECHKIVPEMGGYILKAPFKVN